MLLRSVLILIARRDFYEISVLKKTKKQTRNNNKRGRNKKRGGDPTRDRPVTFRVGVAPSHTFPFRQDAAAQAEQRGETDPLRKTGCHRGFSSKVLSGMSHSMSPLPGPNQGKTRDIPLRLET